MTNIALKRFSICSKRCIAVSMNRKSIRSHQTCVFYHKSQLLQRASSNLYIYHYRNFCQETKSSSTESAKPEDFDEHENIPEPPESGKRLFRDGIIVGIIAMIAAWTWTLYTQRRDNYDNKTLDQVYSVRAHIQHALRSQDTETRVFHLNQAETHCRKALEDLGGGYLSTNMDDSEEKIEYDAQIVAVHVQLGKICYLLHKYQAAIDNYLIVLKALTQEFGYKSRELILPCRQISDCYMNLGQYQMSIMFLERALGVIKDITVGDTHNEYAPICQQMAVLLRKQFKWKESIEYGNEAIKGGKKLLGDNHIQIAHMFLGRACAEMELKEWEIAERSARNALKIVESGPRVQSYTVMETEEFIGNKVMEGGIKNTIKNKVKSGFMGDKTEKEMIYEKEMQLEQQRKQTMANSVTSGVSSSEQLTEMKCSILYIIGQSLIEQDRLREAELIFNNALRYATDLNDTTKQLLIHDQLRDIQQILNDNMPKNA